MKKVFSLMLGILSFALAFFSSSAIANTAYFDIHKVVSCECMLHLASNASSIEGDKKSDTHREKRAKRGGSKKNHKHYKEEYPKKDHHQNPEDQKHKKK